MQFDGAEITEQGVTFAIAIVQSWVLNNQTEAERIILDYRRAVFGNIPVILMAQDSFGTPTYYGRPDIVNFLADVPVEAIPWQRYTLN